MTLLDILPQNSYNFISLLGETSYRYFCLYIKGILDHLYEKMIDSSQFSLNL